MQLPQPKQVTLPRHPHGNAFAPMLTGMGGDPPPPRPAENPNFQDVARHVQPDGRGDAQPGWHNFFGQWFHGKTILDIGAGLGHSRQRLAAGGNTVTLQDPAGIPGIEISNPLEQIPDNLFDVVTALDVLEHVRDDAGFIAQLCRIARETVVITTPNWNVSKCGNPWHIREYTPEQLLALLEPRGVDGLFTDRDGSGNAATETNLAAFLGTQGAALGVMISAVRMRGGAGSGEGRVVSGENAGTPLASSLATHHSPLATPFIPDSDLPTENAIYVAGWPGPYGGADTELDHLIDLWRLKGVEVYLTPPGGTAPLDPPTIQSVRERGCKILEYHPGIFAGRAVVSFCNGGFLERLPEICGIEKNRPATVLWANCMTWLFPLEIEAHRNGWIDAFLFQSDYQRRMLGPQLEAIREPVRELAGYRPFFNRENRLQKIAFSHRPASQLGYFGMGRVSRDDAAKFPPDFWRIFAKVTSPIPTKTFALGFGDNAKAKCGKIPPCNWLDWQTWTPGGTTAADLLSRIHVLIHKTGGSRENWPRTVIEAMAAGVVVIAEDDYAMRELIEDGVTGFVCKSSDEMSFRASELAFDEPRRERMATAAYERFLSEHANVERSWGPWETLLTGSPPAPARAAPH